MPNYNVSAFRAATPGLGALAQALVGGNQAFEQGREQAVTYQSKIANALAQQRAHDATADLAGAKAASERAELEARSPTALRDAAMLNSGIPSDEAPTVDAYLQTGKLGSRYDTPAVDGVGPTMPAPDWASKLGNVAAMIGGNRNAIAIGDKSSKSVAEGRQIDRASALSDAILAGTQNRNAVAGAQAAMDGKPMYHAGGDGGVLDLFAGSLNTDNPLAKSTIGLRGAQAGAQNASAANSYASAGQHKAATEKIRTETGQIINAPKGKFDAASGMLIDERAGTARPIMVDGKPMAGRTKELTEGQAKDNGYGSRMQEADSILNQLQGKYSPASVNSRVAADNSVVPGIGMVANWLQSEEGQRAEQAQRDFINAILRRESGAAIAPSEFANATKQYFPQPNDKPETIKQKARNRQIAIEGVFGSVPKDRRGVPSLTSAQPVPAAPGPAGFTYLGKE
ncbi:hypothetical protein RD110_08115 [Rhodoferax koreense]|uniref:Uncharacterized protein n=1 Tax=Rhodoferax koreensis TaxID=1842727 RepID=A0A1P8JTW8_9BURK|nr:hypothetical protein [Rhodoferax koreense]APW37168.1 hypothetical protein RD110_08115 [Rhodoferax koreense]